MNATKEVTTRRPATSHAWDDLIRRMERELQKVRERAFGIFQMRDPNLGSEIEDWLKAERELFAEYPAELKDLEKEVCVTVGVPGFEAKDLTVTVLPESIVVEGKMEKKEKGSEETREFLRHFALPCVIRTEGVKAELDSGKLTVTAVKAEPKPAPKPVEVKTEAAKAVSA